MSFSGDVKNELAKHVPNSRHCQMAELSALLAYGNVIISDTNNVKRLRFLTENIFIIKKVFTIVKKSFNIRIGVFYQKAGSKSRSLYGIDIFGNKTIKALLSDLRIRIDDEGGFVYTGKPEKMNSCCRFSFIRGAFLMLGSISDPAKSYHMEFDAGDVNRADVLSRMLGNLIEDVKVSMRKGHHLIYIKDSSVIADVLAAMGASVSLMNYENTRIINETRGMVNRRVNCEVGNLKKAAAAGQKQIQDIELIIEKMGVDNLPGNLKEIAELRISNPEASLQELGEMMNPPLGRSGVNHRLQKLMSIAEGLRTS